MKKSISLFAALLVAVCTLAVSGCATSHDDLEPAVVDLSQFYLRGTMTNWCNDTLEDGKLTLNSDGTFSIEYTAKAVMEDFAIADSDWAGKFCGGATVTVDGTEVELAANGGNAKVSGQVASTKYKMTIRPSVKSVFVKVVTVE